MGVHKFIMEVIDLKKKYFEKDSKEFKWITEWIGDLIIENTKWWGL